MTGATTFSRFLNDRRGTAAVEFAIAVNLFIALLIGIFAVGYVYVVRSDIENSIAAAERYALVHEEDDDTLKSIMRSKLATYDGNKITLSLSRGSSGGVDFVKARISYTVDLGVPSIFGPVSISTARIFPT